MTHRPVHQRLCVPCFHWLCSRICIARVDFIILFIEAAQLLYELVCQFLRWVASVRMCRWKWWWMLADDSFTESFCFDLAPFLLPRRPRSIDERITKRRFANVHICTGIAIDFVVSRVRFNQMSNNFTECAVSFLRLTHVISFACANRCQTKQ